MAKSYFVYGGKNFYSNDTVISNDATENFKSRFDTRTFNSSSSVITNKALSDSSFTIIDAGTEFSSCTHIFATNTNDSSDIPELELKVKLNSESISGIATDMYLNDDFTPSTFYLVLTNYSDFLSGKHTTNLYDPDNCDGIISFSVDSSNNSLSSPTIVQAGKFITTHYSGYPIYDFNCDGYEQSVNVIVPYYEDAFYEQASITKPEDYIRTIDNFITLNEDPDKYKKYLASCKVYLAPVSSINILPDTDGLAFTSNSYVPTTGGYYIPLDATFKVKRTYSDLDATLSSENAVLSAVFKLNPATVIISGGSNYVVGDTFTSDDGAATTVATHTVNKVDRNGSIISTTLTNPGVGFTSEPTVTYNGSTGSGATVTVNNNNYSVSSIEVSSGGNGYCITDTIEIRNSSDEVLYNNNLNVAVNVVRAINTDIKLNDKMSLEDVGVVYGGNNFSEAPTLQLYNLKTKTNIDNTSSYVTANADNFTTNVDMNSLRRDKPDILDLGNGIEKGYETNVSRTFYYPTDTDQSEARHRPIVDGYADLPKLKTYRDGTHD